jgi:hypothetical protein
MERNNKKGSALGKRGRARIRRTPEEVREQLREQYGFLTRSAAAYDAGFEGEAMRLATTLRILLHDSSSSRSLLGQLQVKDALRFEDTAMYPNPRLIQKAGLVIIQWTTGTEVRHVAPLADLLSPDRIHPPLRFKRWWTVRVIEGSQGRSYSRRDLVLTMANQDGGAHVDPELDADYALLRRDSLGVTHETNSGDAAEGEDGSHDYVELAVALQVGPDGRQLEPPEAIRSGTPAMGNVAAASVRQIAYEVQTTLERRLARLLTPE